MATKHDDGRNNCQPVHTRAIQTVAVKAGHEQKATAKAHQQPAQSHSDLVDARRPLLQRGWSGVVVVHIGFGHAHYASHALHSDRRRACDLHAAGELPRSAPPDAAPGMIIAKQKEKADAIPGITLAFSVVRRKLPSHFASLVNGKTTEKTNEPKRMNQLLTKRPFCRELTNRSTINIGI